RLLALHRRPRPRRRRRLLRHLRCPADLRRVRAARARHRADVLRALVLVQGVRLDGLGEDLPARRGRARVSLGHQGARAARRRRAAAAGVLASRGRRSADRGIPSLTWQFTLTGLLSGVLVGLAGRGGGWLLAAILVIVFGFKPTYAVGPDIRHGAIFKTFGADRVRRLEAVHARLTL